MLCVQSCVSKSKHAVYVYQIYSSLVSLWYYDSEMQPTLCNITDAVFEVGSSTAPGHVLQTERLVWTQHDDLNGTWLQQSDLVFCCQLSETHSYTVTVITGVFDGVFTSFCLFCFSTSGTIVIFVLHQLLKKCVSYTFCFIIGIAKSLQILEPRILAYRT